MKKISQVIIYLLFAVLLVSCDASRHLVTNPMPEATLKFQDKSGTNASSVAFHPSRKIYYIGIAGNAEFPLEAYNDKGRFLKGGNVGFDMRGLWYNPLTNNLEGNQYQGGVKSVALDGEGLPTKNVSTIYSTAAQPDNNACGAYDYHKSEVVYYNAGKIHRYSRFDGTYLGSLEIKVPANIKIDEEINATSLIYTGRKKYELGLLNHMSNKVYLFDKTTGNNTATLSLPENAVSYHAFRFGYANNMVWLYDANNRTWTGYKIFKK